MATWTFSSGTVLRVDETHATVVAAGPRDAVARDLNADLDLVAHSFPVAVHILPPISERLDLKNAQIVDLWARKIAARWGQTVTVDEKIERFDLGPLELDPKRIY